MAINEIYLAGGVFSLAERFHNAKLGAILAELYRYKVILPQKRATLFMKDGVLLHEDIAEDCLLQCVGSKRIFVGCIDGPDADSGTAFECREAVVKTGRAIVYRTDIRTAPEKELGMNLMFRAKGVKVIYLPCYAASLGELTAFYRTLASRINTKIKTFA